MLPVEWTAASTIEPNPPADGTTSEYRSLALRRHTIPSIAADHQIIVGGRGDRGQLAGQKSLCVSTGRSKLPIADVHPALAVDHRDVVDQGGLGRHGRADQQHRPTRRKTRFEQTWSYLLSAHGRGGRMARAPSAATGA